MADDNTIIEGAVKFRDGKKWKSRWCVMRKLSPVADCVHLQLYRDAKARFSSSNGRAGGECKASLSLAQFVGSEAGFALDHHCNTLALLCRDVTAVVAFDTRERLLQWQVKVNLHLGVTTHYLVLLDAAPRPPRAARTSRGPARLHLAAGRCALTTGTPPSLMGVWELAHLRRYGVVEGRFCFEGGSLCGKGEGLHVLITDQAELIARDFDLAALGKLTSKRQFSYSRTEGTESPASMKAFRPDTRLSELNSALERSLPVTTSCDSRLYEDSYLGHEEDSSSQWAAGGGDAASLCGNEGVMNEGAVLARCSSCMSALGQVSRSTSVFHPAWTMEAVADSDVTAPPRPPRPVPPRPVRLALPAVPRCHCAADTAPARVGPYDNYDVPKLLEEVDEYYDTPKRLKECLNKELFKMTKSSTTDSLILKKSCGCLLKLGRRRKEPLVVESGETLEARNCACRRVTDWAQNLVRLPYCRNKENLQPLTSDLYATVDLSRKTRRKKESTESLDPRKVEIDDGPLANYENLNFALSLEHYENAKDLLRKAGVTRDELDAISVNLNQNAPRIKDAKEQTCNKCGHLKGTRVMRSHNDYLTMQPAALDPAGYTPMSPRGALAYCTLRPPRVPPRLLEEKSASNPALCRVDGEVPDSVDRKADYRKRSSSADSSRFLEDVKEFDGSASSSETLRDVPIEGDGHLGNTELSTPVAPRVASNRDSSSSNDSGVSLRARRTPRRTPVPPRSLSSGRAGGGEAEAPVAGPDSRSTSSGTSDMSDYIETLSLCSSHSSTDTPITMRVVRQTTSTLRPRSGKEYQLLTSRAAPPTQGSSSSATAAAAAAGEPSTSRRQFADTPP